MHTLADTTTIERLRAGAENESDLGGNMDSPGIVIEQVGRCRVVVTGAYHAAVFALSQGIPAVVLSDSKSLYYMDKLTGLADQFGCGCEVVLLDMPDLPRRLTSAIDRAWQTAEDVRAPLLAAAGRQIEESEAAYRRFALISAQEPNSLLNSNTNSFEVRTHA
jgi:colanic acid/amylovoran biosynthesis protein